MRKPLIYFLCTGNSCRSPMAEGWARAIGQAKVEVHSAGTEAHGLNPRAVDITKAAGIGSSGQTSQVIDFEFLRCADHVITL